MTSVKPTERFSSRVEAYIKYRPSYPSEVIELLKEACDLKEESVIADVGAGTGILTELFLKNEYIVYAIEPNSDMREAAERHLQGYTNFRSLAATAEAIPLQDRTVDLVVAAQAFHWFDQARTRKEFKRILKPDGWIALIWNERRLEGSPFLEAYEHLLVTYGTDYEEVRHESIGMEELTRFFAPASLHATSFPNYQQLDREGIKGRLYSSSYTPEPGHPNYEPMVEAVERLFEEHRSDGQVTIEYDTKVYYGQLTGE